jgi:hypothetical protein
MNKESLHSIAQYIGIDEYEDFDTEYLFSLLLEYIANNLKNKYEKNKKES